MTSVTMSARLMLVLYLACLRGSQSYVVMQQGPQSVQPPPLLRRSFLSLASAASLAPGQAVAKCSDIESCREEGDKRIAQQEADAGPKVNLGNGVRYREPRRGTGDLELKAGDVAEITFQVTTTGGNYMYSLGRSVEPGQKDLGETLRIVLGRHDVPIAVEMAIEGMKKGGIRKVEMPPKLGFSTSNGQPAPTTFSGKKKMERYEALLTGNGLQPGYEAELIFEVELVKIRPRASKAESG
jgi:FKBP-type peptidyl-prolyl cis-trans isomerase